MRKVLVALLFILAISAIGWAENVPLWVYSDNRTEGLLPKNAEAEKVAVPLSEITNLGFTIPTSTGGYDDAVWRGLRFRYLYDGIDVLEQMLGLRWYALVLENQNADHFYAFVTFCYEIPQEHTVQTEPTHEGIVSREIKPTIDEIPFTEYLSSTDKDFRYSVRPVKVGDTIGLFIEKSYIKSKERMMDNGAISKYIEITSPGGKHKNNAGYPLHDIEKDTKDPMSWLLWDKYQLIGDLNLEQALEIALSM